MIRRWVAAAGVALVVLVVPWGCHRPRPLPPVNTVEPWLQGDVDGGLR